MQFTVLGPIEAVDAAGMVDIGGTRQRRLLAALLANANAPVATDTLIDIVFRGTPPPGAATTIRSYIARLRRVLGGDHGASVVRVAAGYELRVDPEQIDATRFESEAAHGVRLAAEGQADEAITILRNALALWRGDAFGDCASEEWAAGEAARLDELRAAAEEALVDARLDRGSADQVIPELRRLIEKYPFRERLRGQHMLALHRAGRHTEAVRAGARFRSELRAVGLEPTGDLIALEQSIIAHDPALQSPRPTNIALRGYRLGASLGVGHQGEVFRAVQPVIGREVAIKVIRPELSDDPAFIREFDARAQRISRLEQPHVVPIHDYWREPNAAFIVMRLMPGDLSRRLERGPLAVDETTRMVAQLGGALVVAHRAGLVHGAIRPSNVLMDADHNFFLSDFDIAGDAIGRARPEWRGHESPEQRLSQPPIFATDQFGLAVLVGLAVTNVLPFGQRGIGSAADHFPAVHDRRPELGPAVSRVLWHAAAWRPEDRYPDMATFVDDLVRALTVADAATPA